MTRLPDRIEGKVQLRTGDELPVVAFRQGHDDNGLTRYVVACEDGSLLTIDPDSVTGFTLAMLPGHSMAELLFAEDA